MSEDYIFPCVVVRSKEVELLSKEDILKLMELKSVNVIMQVLSEHGYGDGRDLDNPRDFEKVLSKNLEDTYNEVLSCVPDEKVLNFLKYPTDCHNAKVLLKAEFLKTDANRLLIDSGTIPASQMADMIRKRDFSLMSIEMRRAVSESIESFAKTGDPQEIDINLDKACYKDMLTDSQESENEFLLEYVRLLIDLMNVNTYIRLRNINKPRTFYSKVFLEGGNIDIQGIEAKAGEVMSQTGELHLETYLDNRRMDFVKDALYIPFGIEPIVGYLEAKEAEVKNLRMILTAKISGMDESSVRERLRDTYV